MGRPKLPEQEKKTRKTYKLSPGTIEWIDDRSKELGIPKTRYLEKLVDLDKEITKSDQGISGDEQ